MKIFVLGGDGFCGWPTSLRLAAKGHDVVIVDDLSRRRIDIELSSNSLTNIATIQERVEYTSKYIRPIQFVNINIAEEYERLLSLIRWGSPGAIVHFAEQRTAPYSMMGAKGRRYTVDNNVNGTHNVLSAIVDSRYDIHLVHLGTTGVYGYNKDLGQIPEGYLDVNISETGQDVSILYPTNPGSIYHMTKSMDQILFQYYNKNWNLKITDLHQGIVWGTQTGETKLHDMLINRFDYDGVYGTVLNRFISQAAAGIPITVYGTGEQTRAFIHISNTVECIRLAIENPPESTDRVRIFNQATECLTLIDLANMLKNKYDAEIAFHENPRKEAIANDLNITFKGLIKLGLKPIFLHDKLIDDVKFLAEKCKDKLKKENILTSPRW